MTQILKGLTIPVTGSTPTTPPSGFGTLYASQSTGFFYKNPSGTNFNLLAPNGFTITRYYTGSATGSGVTQTYLWSKPPGNKLRYIEVCCVGAGGGGGSGRKSTVSNIAAGGGGGGGGAIVYGFFDASSLSSSYTITIGAGGEGGAGQTTNANGIAGTSGGTSSFGSLVIAAGGGGGPAGATVDGIATGGNAMFCTPEGPPYVYNGCNGGFRNNVPDLSPPGTTIIFNPRGIASIADTISGNGGGGGGIGGGRNGTTTTGTPATRGSSGYQFNTLINNSGSIGNSGSSGGNATPPTNNMITTLLQFTGSTTIYGLGGGGHGGGHGTTGNGGNGSNGGLYGAGGGGGGSSATATALSSSGAGGSGSSGLCIVVEFY